MIMEALTHVWEAFAMLMTVIVVGGAIACFLGGAIQIAYDTASAIYREFTPWEFVQAIGVLIAVPIAIAMGIACIVYLPFALYAGFAASPVVFSLWAIAILYAWDRPAK